jgi:hypothetical protein
MIPAKRYRHIFSSTVVRVLLVEALRTRVINTDTGEREWVSNADLHAAYRPIGGQPCEASTSTSPKTA